LATGKPGIDIAIPSFGCKSSVSICRTFGFIRKCKVTDASRCTAATGTGRNKWRANAGRWG
jgi:hypothetical protein